MNAKYKKILILIVLISGILRGVSLDKVPPHLSNDEISIAYDAYSVSKTLRDEHNHFLPLSFQSHGTYKAPLAIYLSVIPTMLLGNNEYSPRLVSAILGTLTVFILALLVHHLTKNSTLSLLTALVLALAPWHIYTSRLISETNVALFFVVLGIYCFFKGLDSSKKLPIFIGSISLALSMYAYHTQWVFVPILVPVMLLLYLKQVKKLKSTFILAACLFVLMILPLGGDYLRNLNTTARANTEGFYNDPGINSILKDPSIGLPHKTAVLISAFISNYSSYINLGFLFSHGVDFPPKPGVWQLGLFLTIFLPSFFVGFTGLKKFFGSHSNFILAWCILAPIIPALTRGGPTFHRSLIAVAPFSIVIALGSYIIWNSFKNRWQKLIIILLLIVSIIYMLMLYYIHFPIQSGEGFQYGYKQIALYINSEYTNYDRIVIDPLFGDEHQFVGVPHLYISYFTNIDPGKFLRERKNLPTGLFFDKYEIRAVNWNREQIETRVLYIVPTSNEPNSKELTEVFQVNLPNGKPQFRLYRLQ